MEPKASVTSTGFSKLSRDLTKAAGRLDDATKLSVYFAKLRAAFDNEYRLPISWKVTDKHTDDATKALTFFDILPMWNTVIRLSIPENSQSNVATLVSAFDEEPDLRVFDLAKILLDNSPQAEIDPEVGAYVDFQKLSMISSQMPDPKVYLNRCLALGKLAKQYVPEVALIRYSYENLHPWWRETPGVLPKLGSPTLRSDKWVNYFLDITVCINQSIGAWRASNGFIQCGGGQRSTGPIDIAAVKTKKNEDKEKPKSFRSSARIIVCYRCGEVGHTNASRSCPNEQNLELVRSNCLKHNLQLPKFLSKKPSTSVTKKTLAGLSSDQRLEKRTEIKFTDGDGKLHIIEQFADGSVTETINDSQ